MPTAQEQNEIITWTDSAGNVTNLGWLLVQNDLQVVFGRKGAYMPPAIFAEYRTPFQDGSLITFLNYDARSLDLTCELFCDDIIILRQRMTALLQAFRPDKPKGTLSITNEVGITRQLVCTYQKGLEGDEQREWGQGFVGRFVLTFKAPGTFWTDPTPAAVQTITVTGGSGGGSPTVFTQSAVLTNAGTVQAWPVWNITCPHSATIVPTGSLPDLVGGAPYTITISVINDTTGDYFVIVFNRDTNAAGSIVTTTTVTGTDTVRVVDARMGIDTIRDGGGILIPASLILQNFFALVPGNNAIRIQAVVPAHIVGANDTTTFNVGTTTVTMNYQAQFLGL